MSSGAGLQKIAASLFVGVFVGIGGASQFGEDTQTGVNGASQITVRGATAPVEDTSSPLSYDIQCGRKLHQKVLAKWVTLVASEASKIIRLVA
jgi:hypothetical protein